MCTVSFVCSHNKVIITSNRDEKVIRPSAIPPKNYIINGKHVFFPKDSKAGGTWFAVTADGTVLVLLNGADEKHKAQLSYRKSRGLIVLEIISSVSSKDFWDEINLENIEPFTLVLFQGNRLFQLRWNGIEKESVVLDVDKNHIWSSSTLYPRDIREKRANWFHAYLDTKPEVDETEMFNFHRYTEEKNQENGLVINRNDLMKTLSITQAVIEKNKVVLSHYDLQQQKDFTNTFITI